MEYLNGWTKESVAEHVKTNFKGVSMCANGSLCMYRGVEGRKCVVGMFIPDDKFSPGMEEKSANRLFELYHTLESVMPFDGITMAKWQVVHDRLSHEENKKLSLEEQLETLLKFLD